MIKQIKNYPYIEIQYDSRNIALTEEYSVLKVLHYMGESTIIDVTDVASIYCLDQNVKIEGSVLYPLEEGTSIVKASYNNMVTSVEFLIHDTFFKDNYITHFLPQYDSINIDDNDILKAIFDTLFEFIDIIYAYQADMNGIINPLKTKSKYLTILTKEMGFDLFENLYEGTSYEVLTNQIYRNILNRLADILEVRGNMAAYELFFGALGFDVEMFEFWFDEDENLVEINSTDFTKTTFLKYTVEGKILADNLQTYDDVRINGRKSNYVKLKYTRSINLPNDYIYPKSLIQSFLEFLKPNHIQYLIEVSQLSDINETIPQNAEVTNVSEMISWYNEDDDPVVNTQIFTFSSLGRVARVTGQVEIYLYQYISDNSVKLIAKGGHAVISNRYTFISEGQLLRTDGEADCYRWRFTSSGQLASLSGNAELLTMVPEFDPRKLGTQIGKAIHWYDYLTQADRDNFETGFVAKIPADFFALDFKLNSVRTYNETAIFSKAIMIPDSAGETIRTLTRFDSGWKYDDATHWDSFIFLLERTSVKRNDTGEYIPDL